MKNIVPILLFVCLSTLTKAQNSFVQLKHNDKVTFIKLDSLQQKHTTVIEYDKFLILCELPLITKSGIKNLEHETENGKALLNYLQKEYHKPIKYILSSHWHKHSLSGIIPFLENGTKIITTSYNWEKALKNKVLLTEDSRKYNSKIVKINKDSLLLEDSEYPILLTVMDTTYHNKPTDDYIFPYFVKDKELFVSCMGAIKDIDYNKVKVFTYSSRLTDIIKLVEEKKLQVEQIIRLSFSKRCLPLGCSFVFPYKEIKQMVAKGESMEETIKRMESIRLNTLKLKQDSILLDAIAKQMPSSIFKVLAYNYLEKKEYEEAIIYAKLLNLYYPGIASYINTLGECYYRKGDFETARHYHFVVRKKTEKYGWEEWEKISKK